MKKLIFLLLLAQTISFLYGDAGCKGNSPAHSYHGYNENPGDAWGMRIAAPGHANCDCNCVQYARAHNKCINCGHINIPKALKINSSKKIKKAPVASSKPQLKSKVIKKARKSKAKSVQAQNKVASQPISGR